MTFDYFVERTYVAQLEIEDVGNVALVANNDEQMYFYLIIRTTMGSSQIFECGPIVPDVELLPDYTKTEFTRIDFDVKKIDKYIRNFLNNPKNKITNAEIISVEEALNECRDIVDYMKNFGDNKY